MAHPMRPPMHLDHVEYHLSGFKEGAEGHFYARPSQEIYNWIECLHTSPQTQDDDYPTPWSWPLAFEAQLYQTAHPQHAPTLQLWRSALIGVVLHTFFAKTLQLEAFEITDQAPTPFAQSLSQLLPSRHLHPHSNWQQGYLWMSQDIPLWFSHPTCLICPSADHAAPLTRLETLPLAAQWLLLSWLQQTHRHLQQTLQTAYRQPLSYYDLALHELLCDFIHAVATQLQQQQPTTCRWPSHLSATELADHNALITAIEQQGIQFQQAAYLQQHKQQVHHLAGIWKCFETLPEIAPIAEKDTPLRLQTSPDRSPERALIVLSPDFLINSDLNHYPRVLGQWSLKDLLQQQMHETDPQWCGKQYLEHSRWIWADAIWLPHLYVFAGKDSLPGIYQTIPGFNHLKLYGECVTPALPLQSWILDYLNPYELAARLRFTTKGNEVKVHFRLPLANGAEHEITKTYPLNHAQLLSHIPVFKVWPSQQSPLIHHYWTYYAGFGQRESICLLRPWGHRQTVQHSGAFSETPRKRLPDHTSTSAIDMEIQVINAYPEALICIDKVNTHQEIGFLLMSPPPSLTPPRQEATIAIDLGTTKTQARIKMHGQELPLSLHKQHLAAITQGSFDYDLYEDFLADHTIDLPFLTLFKTNQVGDPTTYNYQTLIDGHIYYVNTIDSFENDERLRTDLKWDTHDKRVYLTAFIEQMCMQLTLEALTKGITDLHFRFSYPLAFSQFDLKAFEQAVGNALKHLHQTFSPVIQPQAQFYSEGLAAAYYFAQGRTALPAARFHQGVVIIDIGGGTTDITIIEGKQSAVRYISSIKFAGRDIFMRLVLDYLPVLEQLGMPKEQTAALQKDRERYGDHHPRLIAKIDALIHEYEEELFKNLKYKFEMPEIKAFISHLALGVAGLFFHIGQILQYLHQEKRYEQQHNLPMIYLAGNGSRILKWFDRNTTHQNPYHQLFDNAFRLFGRSFLHQVKGALTYYSSSDQGVSKPEIASGMLVNPGLLEITNTHIKCEFIAGEDFSYLQTTASALTAIQRDILPHIHPQTLKLEQLAWFMKHYLRWADTFLSPRSLLSKQEKKMLQKVQANTRKRLQELIQSCSTDAERLNYLRDEQILFLQGLKEFYFQYAYYYKVNT